jgi:hypothetical protein
LYTSSGDDLPSDVCNVADLGDVVSPAKTTRSNQDFVGYVAVSSMYLVQSDNEFQVNQNFLLATQYVILEDEFQVQIVSTTVLITFFVVNVQRALGFVLTVQTND